MEQAIQAYRQITAESEFKELERLRSLARHNEAAALRHARDEAKAEEREKWQAVVAEKDVAHTAALAEKDTALTEKEAALAEKEAALAEKDAALAEKEAEIAELRARLEKLPPLAERQRDRRI